MAADEIRGEDQAPAAWTSGGVVAALAEDFGGGDAGPGTTFTDGGGLVLSAVQVQLVFWGSAWSSATNPSLNHVVTAVQTILNSPYMLGLAQYRGIGLGTLAGTTTITNSNPPNPFSDANVQSFLGSQITARALPSPVGNPQLLYVVIPPSGVPASGPFIGEHSFVGQSGVNVHYAWVTISSLAGLTTIFSHELVESCSDPEGTAITGVAGTCGQSGWCEIGDVCQSTNTVCGVTVQSYWSQQDHSCIVPRAVAAISVPTREDCEVPFVEGQEVEFHARLVGSPAWINLSSLSQLSSLSYQWTASAGTITGAANGQQLKVRLPGSHAPMSVSVTITDGGGCQYQASYNLRPIDAGLAGILELLCELRKYAQVNLLVNPLWDPLPDPWTIPTHAKDIRALDRSLRKLAEMSDRVLKLYESEVGKIGR